MKMVLKLLNLSISALFLTSCGQTFTGTYTGTESGILTVNNASSQISNIAITLSLTHANNDMISGSWQSEYGTGTISIRPSGEASLAFNLIKTFPNTPFSNLTLSGPILCGTYVGKLTVTLNQISGKLDLTQPTVVANPPQAPFNLYGITSIQQICPASRQLNVSK